MIYFLVFVFIHRCIFISYVFHQRVSFNMNSYSSKDLHMTSGCPLLFFIWELADSRLVLYNRGMVLMLKMCKFDYHKFDSKLKGKECFSKDNFVVIFSHMSALYVYSRCVHKNSLMSMLKFIFCELLEFLRRMSNLVSLRFA